MSKESRVTQGPPVREALWDEFVSQVPYELYPVQEEAILQWFTNDQGVLVCAPTGTGKTLIAEAAVFEALKTGSTLYYTTPLIALTDQKLDELQAAAERWGFDRNQVGLVTGNRRVNPDANVLVVVAEILLNRLMHHEAFDFDKVSGVVMDEFHSFNEPERGIVWELSLGLLPRHVRTMLLSATVGNAYEFCSWLRTRHDRDLALVQSDDRKVPLSYHWIGDTLLTDHLEWMFEGSPEARKTPSLIFCFNREECWTVAQQLRGKRLVDSETQARLAKRLEDFDLGGGAGPTLKQLLMRGVGVHHAGLLPKFRRVVETLFQEKLLSVTVCTETLAAGINLPARSVVLPTLLKGPPDRKKVIEASAAHQMFGRAGRPQFDSEGFVYALAHEDDVKLLKWKEKYEQIPEDTKDPGLLKARKALKKKMPKRRENQQYWTEPQFEKLRDAPASKLTSRGGFPWRLLAYMLQISSDVAPLREFVRKRLLPEAKVDAAIQELHRMLVTLHRSGYVALEPKPPREGQTSKETEGGAGAGQGTQVGEQVNTTVQLTLTLGQKKELRQESAQKASPKSTKTESPEKAKYEPLTAEPEEAIAKLLKIRSVNPLYGLFLLNHLGIADTNERLQLFESILELPNSLGRSIRVPPLEELPAGPLATQRIDHELLQLGLASAEELGMQVGSGDSDSQEEQRSGWHDDDRVYELKLADKMRRLFDYEFPGVAPLRTNAVWVAGELLEWGGDFDKYISSKRLHKQEGMIFRHLLRLILLLDEFAQLTPPEVDAQDWQDDLYSLADRLTEVCQTVDPTCTDEVLSAAKLREEADLGF
jgi:superfamily II DNA/RNA helicase